MWCSDCQQDVPGVAASATDPTVCCARCAKPFFGIAETGCPLRSKDSSDVPDFIELEDWELNETLQRTDQLMRMVRGQGLGEPKQQTWARIDAPHQSGPQTGQSATRPPLKTATKSTSTVAWSVMALGLATFVCGAALMAISLVAAREQLWQLGLPMVLGGQVAILAVVIWQLEAVWQSNRATFVALHAMDEQLRQLRDEPVASESRTERDPNLLASGNRN
mgnify:CR=1 FL=1